MFKGFLEKVVLNPALVVFILGVVVFVIAAFGQLPIGQDILVVDDNVGERLLGGGCHYHNMGKHSPVERLDSPAPTEPGYV